MENNRFAKEFHNTTCLEITQAELRRRLLPDNFMAKLYARHPDGTPNWQVSLDVDIYECQVDGEGTLTIQLLTPRSGVVVVFPLTPPPLMR